jgi:hypothetical protein
MVQPIALRSAPAGRQPTEAAGSTTTTGLISRPVKSSASDRLNVTIAAPRNRSTYEKMVAAAAAPATKPNQLASSCTTSIARPASTTSRLAAGLATTTRPAKKAPAASLEGEDDAAAAANGGPTAGLTGTLAGM